MKDMFKRYVIPSVILFVIIISSIGIGNFFNISITKYIGYLLWFMGLTIMSFILPTHRSSKFINDENNNEYTIKSRTN